MILSLKPKYIPLVQKPSCCNVTCLQMILYRRGFGLFDQQELAKYFKIKISKKETAFFNVKFKTYTSVNEDGGLRTIDSEKIINKFFKESKISLVAHSVKYSKINDLKEFILENIKNNNDLWLEYKMNKIHKEKSMHDNVVESIKINKKRTFVTVVDPYWEYKPRYEISIKDLSDSISKKYGRETGFIVISNK